MPRLENIMYNYMKCSMMLFGRRVRYCITYSAGEVSFTVYTRKYRHSFTPTLYECNFERSTGLVIPSMNALVVTDIDKIKFFDIDGFDEYKECELLIPLLKFEPG